MKILKQIQQGDVWIEKVDNFIGFEISKPTSWGGRTTSKATEAESQFIIGQLRGLKATNNFILAAGEATGHHHRLITADGVLKCEKPIKVDMDRGIFELMEKAILSHEEHLPLELEPGFYRFGIINEYDYDAKETRKVWD